jgi:hypothetical protein
VIPAEPGSSGPEEEEAADCKACEPSPDYDYDYDEALMKRPLE